MTVGGPESVKDGLPKVAGLGRLRAVTQGDPAIRVAVLDGPFDAAAVADVILPSGAAGHGTLVCSIIKGSRDGLIPGVAPGCTLISIPVFEGDASGGCSQDDMARAIDRAMALGVHLINISASQLGDALALSSTLSAAIQRAVAADVLIVAATGNQGCACDTIPASAPGVLAVGAHGEDGLPLLSSNWGAGQRSQGILAPGLSVPGACVGGGVCDGTGTSFATAVASGVAALLMSLQAQLGFKPSGVRTRRVLLAGCDRATPEDAAILSRYLAGRLDVSAAIELLVSDLTKFGAEGVVMETVAEPVRTEPAAGAAPAAERLEAAGAGLDRGAQALEGGTIMPADCGCGGGGHGECKCGGGAGCTCGGKAKTPQLVYAIGRLGVSFVSMARRDAVWRSIHGGQAAKAGSVTPEVDLRPIDNASLRGLFEREPWQSQSVVWTLSRTEVPMYAIVAAGAFAERTLNWLIEQWSDPEVEFISLPGVIAGQMTLYDGMTVDVVVPDLRGMYSWNSALYSKALAAASPRAEGEKKPAKAAVADGERIRRFLSKVYYRIRNRGLAPEERALNAAATNAFNLSDVIVTAGREGLAFKDVSVEKSPFNRPGGQYYDVLLTFFAPDDRLGTASLVARFTIDVSDTVPVVVGEPVEWYEF